MPTFAILQAAAEPGWVGPTTAISLAVIAVSILGAAVAAAIAFLRVSRQVTRVGALADSLQDDVRQTLTGVRRLTEQGQDLVGLIRNEAGAYAHTGRRLRRKMVRGVDRMEGKLTELETLYDLLHDEVEDTALDFAAALRRVRRGNGVLGRVRRMLVPGR